MDEALKRAKRRLDSLALYPRKVRVGRVRIVVAPALFRLPWFRNFDGYATHFVIFVRRSDVGDDLITHELCHVWQMQHKPFAMPISYLYHGYERNPYELEARRAAAATQANVGEEAEG